MMALNACRRPEGNFFPISLITFKITLDIMKHCPGRIYLLSSKTNKYFYSLSLRENSVLFPSADPRDIILKSVS